MSHLVTIGEGLAVLASTTAGPLRYANQLDVRVAGSELNVAIAFRRLGGESTWLGRISEDEFGLRILAALRSEDVDASRIIRDRHPTALLLREQRTSDIARISYYRHDSPGRHLRPDDLDFACIENADILHLTGITVALSKSARDAVFAAIRCATAAEIPISLDCNVRRALWNDLSARDELSAIAVNSAIVFGSRDELELLVGPGTLDSVLNRTAALGPTRVIAKLGKEGATSLTDGVIRSVAGRNVTQVDPVGAGDAFVAGYLSEYLRGATEEACLDTGNICGAICASTTGDYEGTAHQFDLELLRGTQDVQR